MSANPITSQSAGKTQSASKTPQYKSKLAANQMESIVSNIRSRLSQDKIAKMSQEELQSRVMDEIIKSR
jgi:transcriptional regulator NrdR family protein